MLMIVFLCFIFTSHAAFSRDAGPVFVIYRLYKDYGWAALFHDSDGADASKFLGKSLARQPKNILMRYFDKDLVALLIRDANCVKSNPGKECRLGFDPIFASQDVAAYDLKITDVGEGKVSVEYTYPSNSEKIRLLFFTRKVKDKWKISDIYYGNNSYLKQILDNRK